MNWQHLHFSFAGRTSKRDFGVGLGGLLAASAVRNPVTMGAGLAAAGLAALVGTVAILVSLALLIWAGTRDGDAGINAFGEPQGGAILL